MENLGLSELIIDREYFNSNWKKKDTCAWCERKKLNLTDEQYLSKGNICQECSSKILQEHMKTIEQERKQRLADKKKMLDMLGSQLEHDITEEERKEIVDEMMSIHNQIKYAEVSAEL